MATNPIGLALKPHPAPFAGSLLACLKLLVFGALVTFSFVPVPIHINISQILLLMLSIGTLYLALVRLEVDVLATLLLIICIAVSQALGIIRSPVADKNYLTPVLFLTSMLIGPAVMILARSYSVASLGRLIPRFLNPILVFLVIECISRLILSPHMNVAAEADLTDTFYQYKSSLFFVDSNFAGIAILCLLSIMLTYKEAIGRNRLLLAYFLLFATLSRASIFAGVCQFAIYKLWRWRIWTLFGLLAAQVLIIGKLFLNFTTQGPDAIQAFDGSLSSKFYILSLMTDTYGRADATQKLFGIGVGNFSSLAGIFAHNIVATFVLELGIAGSALLIVYIWILCRKCPVAIYLLILPMVINGFSLVSTSMPYFFVALGLLGGLRGSMLDGTGRLGNGATSWEVLEG